MPSIQRNLSLLRLFLLIAFLLGAVGGWAGADPVVPWAQPQTFPDQEQPSEKPLFERVMEEERRRKQQEVTGTVDAESLKSSQPALQPVPAHSEEFVPLKRGARGPRVKALQEALIALGFGLPAGADGDYGGQTESALKGFQSSANLPLTGKLDKATFQALTEVTPGPGKKIWEDPIAAASLPAPPAVEGKKIRVLIDLSEHRLSVYDDTGKLQRVFPVASGAQETPTHPGLKVVCEKLEDPTALAEKLWPESKGTAFGKRLIDLNWYDPKTGTEAVSDEELHGTYELNSIGGPVSHGCVRLSNESIEWLYQNLQLGDLVLIRE